MQALSSQVVLFYEQSNAIEVLDNALQAVNIQRVGLSAYRTSI